MPKKSQRNTSSRRSECSEIYLAYENGRLEASKTPFSRIWTLGKLRFPGVKKNGRSIIKATISTSYAAEVITNFRVSRGFLQDNLYGELDAMGWAVESGEWASEVVDEWLANKNRKAHDRRVIDALAMAHEASLLIANFVVFRNVLKLSFKGDERLSCKDLDQMVQGIAYYSLMVGRRFEQYAHRPLELEIERMLDAEERRLKSLPKANKIRARNAGERQKRLERLGEIYILEKLKLYPRAVIKAATVVRALEGEKIIETTPDGPIAHTCPGVGKTTIEKTITRDFVHLRVSKFRERRVALPTFPQHRSEVGTFQSQKVSLPSP